jgi:reactive intermediate/imine deaminase
VATLQEEVVSLRPTACGSRYNGVNAHLDGVRVASMMQSDPIKEIITAGPAPVGPYSSAVKAGGFIHISGTLAQEAAGGIVGQGDVRAQTRRVLERVRELLGAAGSSLEQVVSVTVYLTSASDFQAMNEAYRVFWPDDPPTRTTVITRLMLPEALVEMSMIAVPNGADRTVILPSGWSRSPNPYSYAIRTGDTLFLSGLVPRSGRDNSVVAGDIALQTRAVMQNAEDLLTAAGMSFAHVVCTRAYLTDASNFRGMNEAYRTYFPGAPPARATVTSGLAGPAFLVEMTFIASAAPREGVGTPPEGVPISPAIKTGRHLYVSGVLGNTPDTAGDVAAQTRLTLERIMNTLELSGAVPADVVDSVVYLRDEASFGAMNEPYRAFFGGNFPARTTVATPLVVDDGLVEIMVTAVIR